MSKTLLALLALITLLITGCGADPTVDVKPAPTATVTAEPVVETVSVTPQACLEALEIAEESFGIAGEAFALVPGLLDLIPQAYQEGAVGGDGSAIVEELKSVNGQIQPMAPRLSENAEKFNAAKAECRAASAEGT